LPPRHILPDKDVYPMEMTNSGGSSVEAGNTANRSWLDYLSISIEHWRLLTLLLPPSFHRINGEIVIC